MNAKHGFRSGLAILAAFMMASEPLVRRHPTEGLQGERPKSKRSKKARHRAKIAKQSRARNRR